MKRFVSALAVFLCFCSFLSLTPAYAAINLGDEMVGDGEDSFDFSKLNTYAINEETVNKESPASYSYNGYKTYTSADSTLMWTIPNMSEGGTTCTAIQGMNTGTTYCYVAKRNSDDTYGDILRINMYRRKSGDELLRKSYHYH